MLKMLAYRDHPASEWSPLFWSILRNKMTDMQRRSLFRLRWLLPGSTDTVSYTHLDVYKRQGYRTCCGHSPAHPP